VHQETEILQQTGQAFPVTEFAQVGGKPGEEIIVHRFRSALELLPTLTNERAVTVGRGNDEGLFRRELMVAIFADVNAALLAEDDVL